MKITCRDQDKHLFEKLGFQEDHTGFSTVEMVDEEANYAHEGELPENIPWRGYSWSGGSYGASEFACDGKVLLEVEVGNDGGCVIEWDYELRRPRAGCLEHLEKFHDLDDKVIALLEQHEQLHQQPNAT